MSRFDHLELDGPKFPDPNKVTGEAIRDCRHFHERAEAARLAGDFEDALRNYSRALEKNHAFYEGWFGQVRMLIELGEYQEALLWSDKALELFPDHPELLAAKAVACARDEQVDQALAWSDSAIARPQATSYVWLSRAEVLFRKKHRAAENCLSNAIGLAGNGLPSVRLEAGRLLARSGQYSRAFEYLRPAISDLPKSALAWYELGQCQAALGLPEAEATLKQSLQLRPHWDEAKAALRRFQNRGVLGRFRSVLRRLRGR